LVNASLWHKGEVANIDFVDDWRQGEA